MEKISTALLSSLENKYGDSFYLLDFTALKDNYNEFLNAFRNIYPNSNIAYSYKTNYIPKLCQSINSLGGYAEVVSHMEYDLALRIGVAPERIIFNGPYKREPDIEKALLAGSIVNLDMTYEVKIVEAVARKSPNHTVKVGLRCNFDIGTNNISRFGFDVESEEFDSIFQTLDRLENCSVEGLHCHFLPPRRSVKSYAYIAKRMLELYTSYFSDNGSRFIDLGGGFLSKMSLDLREQFPYPVPSYLEYAEAIATQFADAFPEGSGPKLILEPGIGITADVMKFVAKVVDIKKIRSRSIALVSGSIYNIKPTLNEKNLPIRVFKSDTKSRKSDELVDIVGYTCMERDCLYKGYAGPLAVGDYVVFDNVGAYTVVLKPPFGLPSPPILAYDYDLKKVCVVKRQEELMDVFSTYTFS